MSYPLPSKPTKSQLVSAVKDSVLIVGPGMEQSGYAIRSNQRKPLNQTCLIGQITTSGPNGESDFTDSRYYVQILQNSITNSVGKFSDPMNFVNRPDNKVSSGNLIYIASNPAEVVAKTHQLTATTIVEIFPVYIDQPQIGQTQAACQVRWVISSGSTPGIQFVTLANPSGSLGVKGVSAPTIVYDCYVIGNPTPIASAVVVKSTRGLFRVIPAQTGRLIYNWNGLYGTAATNIGGPFLDVYEPPVTCA
jgi:hypothetical protein